MFSDLNDLVIRFVGKERANRAFAAYAAERDINLSKLREADPDLLHFTERLLAGTIARPLPGSCWPRSSKARSSASTR